MVEHRRGLLLLLVILAITELSAPAATIRGRLVDAAGKPLPGTVHAYAISSLDEALGKRADGAPSRAPLVSAVADARGSYAIALPDTAMGFHLEATAVGHARAWAGFAFPGQD